MIIKMQVIMIPLGQATRVDEITHPFRLHHKIFGGMTKLSLQEATNLRDTLTNALDSDRCRHPAVITEKELRLLTIRTIKEK